MSTTRPAEALSRGSCRAAPAQRRRNLVDGDRRQHDDRERDPSEAPVPHRSDPQDERQPDRGARRQAPSRGCRARPRAPTAARRRPGAHPRRPRPPRPAARHLRPGSRARRAAGPAPRRPARRGPGRGTARRAGTPPPTRAAPPARSTSSVSGQGDTRRRQQPSDEQHRPGRRDPDGCVRQQHPQPEVRQPVHVADEPREQVARAQLRETRGREPREPRIDRGAQLGEHPERGVVGRRGAPRTGTRRARSRTCGPR